MPRDVAVAVGPGRSLAVDSVAGLGGLGVVRVRGEPEFRVMAVAGLSSSHSSWLADSIQAGRKPASTARSTSPPRRRWSPSCAPGHIATSSWSVGSAPRSPRRDYSSARAHETAQLAQDDTGIVHGRSGSHSAWPAPTQSTPRRPVHATFRGPTPPRDSTRSPSPRVPPQGSGPLARSSVLMSIPHPWIRGRTRPREQQFAPAAADVEDRGGRGVGETSDDAFGYGPRRAGRGRSDCRGEGGRSGSCHGAERWFLLGGVSSDFGADTDTLSSERVVAGWSSSDSLGGAVSVLVHPGDSDAPRAGQKSPLAAAERRTWHRSPATTPAIPMRAREPTSAAACR